MEIKQLFFLPIFICFLCFSCSQNTTTLNDGYYTSEAMNFDNHGWKEYVTISVINGKIMAVEYDALNNSGFIKSWDMDYMRRMNAKCGTYPNAYTRYYAGQLLNTQTSSEIECLTGATDSYYTFCQLASSAIERSNSGNTNIVLVHIEESEHHEEGLPAR